jgi:hypothetical protein
MDKWLDLFPIWLAYILTVALLLLAMEAGYQTGVYWQKRRNGEGEKTVGTVVTAALALLAFLLAFAVGFGSNLYNERRIQVIDEANAIGTAHLRAGYIGEPQSSEARALLNHYTDLRVDALNLALRKTALQEATDVQKSLWQGVEAVVAREPSPTNSLYVAAVNDLLDLYTTRVHETAMRVPPTVVVALYVVALLCMVLLGLQHGYGATRNPLAAISLALILAVAFALLLDLDRPLTGVLRVPAQPLLELQAQLDQLE